MSQKEIIKFVRENIRSLDTVNSTGTHLVVRPGDKPKPIDEDLIEEEKGNWGPWRI